MKLKTLTAITGLALVATAQAGEEAAAKHVIAPIAPLCNWSWFAGGSVGYVTGDAIEPELDDWDEAIYTLHIGLERICDSGNSSHAFYLEVGYTEHDDSYREVGTIEQPPITEGPTLLLEEVNEVDIDMEIIPITLNYKYESNLSEKLNWYVGAGAGVALFDFEGTYTRTIDGVAAGDPDSDSVDDTVFYAHIFAGLIYNVSDSFELFAGVRSIFMDDPEDGGDSIDAPLDDAVQYEIGARYNF